MGVSRNERISTFVHGVIRALFTVHYGVPRVIVVMKFKLGAALDAEMHLATITSLTGILTRGAACSLNETNARREDQRSNQARTLVFRHRVYRMP